MPRKMLFCDHECPKLYHETVGSKQAETLVTPLAGNRTDRILANSIRTISNYTAGYKTR